MSHTTNPEAILSMVLLKRNDDLVGVGTIWNTTEMTHSELVSVILHCPLHKPSPGEVSHLMSNP